MPTLPGHHAGEDLLQVYRLASTQPGTAVENPRQTSARRRLPGDDALAISGTAAMMGHAIDAPRAHEQLQRRPPGVPVLLHGDVCHSELLVERTAGASYV